MARYFSLPYRVRRFWLAAIGITSLLILVGSLVGDIFMGTSTTANVYLPVTALLGGSFLGYVMSRMKDSKESEDNHEADPK